MLAAFLSITSMIVSLLCISGILRLCKLMKKIRRKVQQSGDSGEDAQEHEAADEETNVDYNNNNVFD